MANEEIRRMDGIKHTILVLSGKGGVGKSTVAVNLAVWLSMRGHQVGLLDADIHGPSVPKLLGLDAAPMQGGNKPGVPAAYGANLRVMSIALVLASENEPVIWRGPMKHNVIQQFISAVDWGPLDFLVVDCPPGTGDEPLSVAQLLPGLDGAVIVTTGQDVAIADVRRCVQFCRTLQLRILGIMENMAGFVCPACGRKTEIFVGDGARRLARERGLAFLGAIPLDTELVAACDLGKPIVLSAPSSRSGEALHRAFGAILDMVESRDNTKEAKAMRIAVPVSQGKVSAHFGHCERFALVDVDPQNMRITQIQMHEPPAHEPGVLPKWLAGLGAEIVIAGGMGQRAQQLFTANGIKVVVGAPEGTAHEVVSDYLTGKLKCGENVCDH